MPPLIFGNSKWPPVGHFESDPTANYSDSDLDMFSTSNINFRSFEAILVEI